MTLLRRFTAVTGTAAAAVALVAPSQALASQKTSFLARFHTITTIASTVPGNGDVNPYGIAVITTNHGKLRDGHVLISNFNGKANLQGTGRTLVEISPSGQRTQFAKVSRAKLRGRCPGGAGLSTALAVLPHGWVVAGSVPSANGQASTARAGCLIFLDDRGRVRATLTGHGINGPWDATATSAGGVTQLFVASVLNGTVAGHGAVVHRGTVLRLDLAVSSRRPPRLLSATTVGSGFAEQTSKTAFVLGPTGLALAPDGTLFVADTESGQITALAAAGRVKRSVGTGTVLTSGGALAMPLGMAIAPGGDILTVNGGNGKIVETTESGAQVATRQLDFSGSPPGAGALFGLAIAPHGAGVYYVDDARNNLRLLH